MRLVTLKSIVQQLLRLFELTVATSCHFTYFIPLGICQCLTKGPMRSHALRLKFVR